MRFRIEILYGRPNICHVQTDQPVAKVRWWADPSRAGGTKLQTSLVCDLANGETLECFGTVPQQPLKEALRAVAARVGYPKAPKKPPDPQRVEWLLGNILADAAAVLARAFVEYHAGGVKAETKARFGELIVQLYDIWRASRFESFNAERATYEPYFENRPPSDPRMNFAEAVQRLGMEELSFRHPHVPEPILKELLLGVLECFKDALDRLTPALSPDRVATLEKLIPVLNSVAPRGHPIPARRRT